MEKYSSSCRLIPCCNSSSKIIQVLEFIGKKENLHLPAGFAARLAAQSNPNLRRAILFFETCKVQQYPLVPNQVAHWEQYVSEIATDILTEQSPKRSKSGTVSHSKWINYDDLNGYFWSKKML
ncbi:hypothetical protein ACP4OV_010494 [Aristida adscensionis]